MTRYIRLMLVEQLDALGLVRGNYHPRAFEDIVGVVIHTTGSGPWQRWVNDQSRFEDPYDAAKHVYTKISGFSGHLLVCGDTGRVAQLAPYDTIARHVSSKGGNRYRWPGWDLLSRNTGWWKQRWPELKSPRGLMSGQAWSPYPNYVTIGIDVAPSIRGPRKEWSSFCWSTLRILCDRLQRQFSIPKRPEHFVSHSDMDPLRRSSRKGPWDPGVVQFDPQRDFTKLFYPAGEERYV